MPPISFVLEEWLLCDPRTPEEVLQVSDCLQRVVDVALMICVADCANEDAL